MKRINNRKFQLRDKVRFTPRVPNEVIANLRQRTRTIVGAWYDDRNKCILYELGGQGKEHQHYTFRSYQLYAVNGQAHNIGRPRKARNPRGRPRKSDTKVLLKATNRQEFMVERNHVLTVTAKNRKPKHNRTIKARWIENGIENIIERG